MAVPRALAIAIWAVPTVVLVLLIAGAWIGGQLFSDLLIPNLAWVIATSGGVGALLATRRPENGIGWLLWLIGIGMGLSMLATFLLGMMSTMDDAAYVPGVLLFAWFSTWSTSVPLIAALLFVPLLFPDGRLPGPAWRPVGVAVVVVALASILQQMIQPGPMLNGSPVVNPFGVSDGPLQEMLGIMSLATPVAVLASLLAVVLRYRHGDEIVRQQLRWFAASMALAGLGFAVIITVPDEYGELGFGLLVFSLGLVPVSIGVAILRYRLYEIDRIISRTIAWLLLTVTLALVFGALIVGLQSILAPFTEGNTLAVAASTLAAFALFQPLRRRIQVPVDRRFNRTRVDAQQAVDRFAGDLRDEVNLDAIEATTLVTVSDTLRPAQVGLWVRRPSGAPHGPHRRSRTILA
jgi:hypothetical protein